MIIYYYFTIVFIIGFFLIFVLKNYINIRNRLIIFEKNNASFYNEKLTIMENIEDGVIIVDAFEKITYINSRGYSFLGKNGNFLLGKPLLDKSIEHQGDLWKYGRELLIEALSTKEKAYNFIKLDNDIKVHLSLIAIPTHDNNGAILFIHDKSDKQKIIDTGKDYIANASHELRTPITIIRGFAETLRDIEEVSEVMYNSILEKIIRNCERMENLVKNLLTLTDLEHWTNVKMGECDLITIIEHACMQVINVYPKIQIEQFNNEDCILIYGNHDLLELAFINILNNGVKYSSSLAEIKVVVTAQQHDVKIDISDKGVGIPSSDLNRIFDRFYTVDKTHSRKLGGAGLGLSIVKTIINNHFGKIYASCNRDR